MKCHHSICLTKIEDNGNQTVCYYGFLDRNKPDRYTKVLAVFDFDAYSNRLNFVFGQAHADGGVSAIYLLRLRHEFYGLMTDNSIL